MRPGTVANFDNDGSAIVLAERLQSATQYVEAMRSRGVIQQESAVEPPR
jgi:hypothetical protein